MTDWGPLTCSVGPGVVHAENMECTIFDSGVVPGNIIRQTTGTATVTSWSGGRNDAAWAMRVYSYDINGVEIERAMVTFSRLSAPVVTWDYLNPITTVRIKVTFNLAGYVGQSATCTSNGTFSQIVYCANGTQLKGGFGDSVYLTPDLLQLLVAAVDAPWLAVPLAIFAFSVVVVRTLCQSPPPPLPAISAESYARGIDFWRSVLTAIMWSYFCECVPGTPSPIPYPLPQPVEPPGAPTPPTFSCSEDDLCASIVEIKKQLAVIAQSLQSTGALVTLVQRYKAPFATVRGARHPNLAGTGDFAVPRLVGFAVDVISRPAGLQEFTGAPTYITDLGWLAIWSNDGILEEVRLTRDIQVWLPEHQTEATRFAYALRQDVVIGVTELEAEV